MKAADHPARRPPGTRPFTAAEAEEERISNAPLAVPADDTEGTGEFAEQAGDEREEPDSPRISEAADEGSRSPLPTREPIETAPHDGRDVIVYFGDLDNEGRLVRYRAGRRFTGRRWVEGGKWVPTDSMMPLPANEPTAWLRYPQSDAEPAAA